MSVTRQVCAARASKGVATRWLRSPVPLALGGCITAIVLAGCAPENLAEVDGYSASATDSTIVVTFHAPSGLSVTASLERESHDVVAIAVAATSATDSHLMDSVCQQVTVQLSAALGARTVTINGDEAPPAATCP
jgi:hypothetical protein